MDELKNHIVRLREDFTKGSLNEVDVNPNPFMQFEHWLSEAVKSEVPEVQAMTLCTVGANLKPSSRIVYLREFENNCFWFYGNYHSRKAQQLEENPQASLNFFWPQLERQIRIEGTVTPCENSYSDSYFNGRPLESKLGAWASQQSSALSSRKELDDAVENFRKQFEGKIIPRPPYWGGWIFKANYYEFWQGRKSRLHDRICYSISNGIWTTSRIAP